MIEDGPNPIEPSHLRARPIKDRRVFALKIVDFGDPDNWDDEYDEGPSVEIVAVYKDPETGDKSQIVRELLDTPRQNGGKYIELYDDIGDFELD